MPDGLMQPVIDPVTVPPLSRNIVSSMHQDDSLLSAIQRQASPYGMPEIDLLHSPIHREQVTLPYCQAVRDTTDIDLGMALRRSRHDMGRQSSHFTDTAAINHETAMHMQSAAFVLTQYIHQQVWAGDPRVGEMVGLDAQVAGDVPRTRPEKSVALTGEIKDFGRANAMTAMAKSGKLKVVEYLSAMAWRLDSIARQSAIHPVNWIVVMRPELWYELAPVWAATCTFRPGQNLRDWTCPFCGDVHGYDLTACVGGCGGAREPAHGQFICLHCGRVYHDNKSVCWDADTGTGCGAIEATVMVRNVEGLRAVIDGDFELSQWIMNEGKLPINGSLFNVVTDRAIPEASSENDDGFFWSSVYFVPLSAGGMPLTFLDYKDYQHAPRMSVNESFWSDDGLYLWRVQRDHWDFRLSVQAEHRVVCRTPHLMGLLKDVGYAMPAL